MGRQARKKQARKEREEMAEKAPTAEEIAEITEMAEIARKVLANGGIITLVSPEGECLQLSLPSELFAP
jgi:DNA-directed RNA polymerase specialized sigma subunit